MNRSLMIGVMGLAMTWLVSCALPSNRLELPTASVLLFRIPEASRATITPAEYQEVVQNCKQVTPGNPFYDRDRYCTCVANSLPIFFDQIDIAAMRALPAGTDPASLRARFPKMDGIRRNCVLVNVPGNTRMFLEVSP